MAKILYLSIFLCITSVILAENLELSDKITDILMLIYKLSLWSITITGLLLAIYAIRLQTKKPRGAVWVPETTPNNQLIKSYGSFQSLIVIGCFVWFPAYGATAMSSASLDGQGLDDLIYTIILYAQFLSLPIALICLFIASQQKQKSIETAVNILKIPLYYGAAFIAVVLILVLLNSIFSIF